MRKWIIISVITLVAFLIIGKVLDTTTLESDYLDEIYSVDHYLNETIFNQILFDYTYLTGNSEELSKEYFESLKVNKSDYSVKLMKKLNVYGENPEKTVLKIQENYDELIKGLKEKEKEDLDKYLLKNALIFYYNTGEFDSISGEKN